MKKKTDQFIRVIWLGALGVLAGILLGYVFGMLIFLLNQVTFGLSDHANEIPVMLATFLGMGAGAVIGGVTGVITALKK